MLTIAKKVNGIDVEALHGAMDVVRQDPCKGVAKFQVKTRWTGGTQSETKVEAWALGGQPLPRNFTLRTDEPPELLGQGAAPNPQEVLMAGLNACMMVGYVAGCAARGVKLDSISIETEGELDLRGFLGLDAEVKPGYDEIRYVVRIRGQGSREQFEEVHRTVMATSPNYYNMANPIRLVPRLIVD